MTSRQKKGVGFLITAVGFGVVGAYLVFAAATPVWIGQALSIVGLVVSALGFTVVFPNETD